MSLVLYGSKPSPYVRRIRMLLANTEHRFEEVFIYEDQARSEYGQISPIRKLPVLRDGEQTIFDSHVIADYLMAKLGIHKPDLLQHNIISAIDAVTDSLIILLLGRNSGLETEADVLLFKLQRERLPVVLSWLEEEANKGAFKAWSYLSMSLLALVEWANFRNLLDFSDYPALVAVQQAFSERQEAVVTRPE